MSGILWHVERKLEGILDRILMEFHEDKNQSQKSMYIPWLSFSFYGSNTTYSIIVGVVLFSLS